MDELGFRVRLIAKAKRVNDGVFAAVYPTAISADHPLATVRNEFNAIFSTGNMVGESMIYGKGAGSLPTGSAVMSDILDIAFDIYTHHSRRNLETQIESASVLTIEENTTQFYMRLSVSDETGALEKITTAFKAANINISNIIQKERYDGRAQVVILTDMVNEASFNGLKQTMLDTDVVHAIDAVVRVGL